MASDAVFEFLPAPPASATALAALSDRVTRWFCDRYGMPTAAQRHAWPALTAGKNLLLSAPTGSGKTLAAFLPIVDRLVASPFASGIRCLYVAPLKALVTDVGRNLQHCLEGLAATGVRVAPRTGDTSGAERRAMRLEPPDILLTTPESLAVLLSQASSESLFHALRWIVIDEVHALAPNKRGADLALSLERLATLAGEAPQRIGLSATCAPLETAAAFLTGTDRPCAIARVSDASPLHLTVEPLPSLGFVGRLVQRLTPELEAHRTTLIFTNVRSLAERLAWSLRRRFPAWAEAIAVHHSSVAVGRRRRVERMLKAGELRAVVSSTSLELGIDIGSVDLVVLVHPPGGVVRLLQRVGRAGHAPGRVRRGLVLTSTPAELLEMAVTGADSRSARCEPLRTPPPPLDVLCQQLVGMACQRPWHPDEAFTLAKSAYPFRDLSRPDFDDCIDYLSGRHRDGTSWLPSRLRWRGDEFTIVDAATARLLRRNLGTIIAEEPRPVCIESRRPEASGDDFGPSADVPLDAVGHVDDAFADRLRPGDRFLLDGRCLELRRDEARSLVVAEVPAYSRAPVWQGSGLALSPELARRLYLLRTRAVEALREGPAALARLLREEYDLDNAAAAVLVDLFERQECVSEVPDAAACLVEMVAGDAGTDCYVHTPLNRAGNDALARVAVRRLARRRGRTVLSMVADLGFILAVEGDDLTRGEFIALLDADGFDDDLTAALAESASLRERFRATALTGLMLLRNPRGGRRRVGGRDWAERRLFEQVRAVDPEFVLLRQAQREVRAEIVDADAARTYLVEFPHLDLRWRWLPCPSPLAEGWTQAGMGPVETTESPAEALMRLHAALMADA